MFHILLVLSQGWVEQPTGDVVCCRHRSSHRGNLRGSGWKSSLTPHITATWRGWKKKKTWGINMTRWVALSWYGHTGLLDIFRRLGKNRKKWEYFGHLKGFNSYADVAPLHCSGKKLCRFCKSQVDKFLYVATEISWDRPRKIWGNNSTFLNHLFLEQSLPSLHITYQEPTTTTTTQQPLQTTQ